MDLDQRSFLDNVRSASGDYFHRVWSGYFPALAFIVAFSTGLILQPCAKWLERRGIDDAVGEITVHGTTGLYGGVILVFSPRAIWPCRNLRETHRQ